MGYLGMIPSEDSSGSRPRQGSITKAGNSSARRALVEAAHAYAHPARVSWVIARRQTQLPKGVCDIAWKAQACACARAFGAWPPAACHATKSWSPSRASSRALSGRSGQNVKAA